MVHGALHDAPAVPQETDFAKILQECALRLAEAHASALREALGRSPAALDPGTGAPQCGGQLPLLPLPETPGGGGGERGFSLLPSPVGSGVMGGNFVRRNSLNNSLLMPNNLEADESKDVSRRSMSSFQSSVNAAERARSLSPKDATRVSFQDAHMAKVMSDGFSTMSTSPYGGEDVGPLQHMINLEAEKNGVMHYPSNGSDSPSKPLQMHGNVSDGHIRPVSSITSKRTHHDRDQLLQKRVSETSSQQDSVGSESPSPLGAPGRNASWHSSHSKDTPSKNKTGGSFLGRLRKSISGGDVGHISEPEDNFFGLHPAWFQKSLRISRSKRTLEASSFGIKPWSSLPGVTKQKNNSMVFGNQSCLYTFLGSLVVRPGSLRLVCWDCLGMLFLLYDAIMIPLQIFEPPENTLTTSISWIMKIYWIVDVPSHFFVGYYTGDGILEVRLEQIAQHYARTWMPFDVLVVLMDWFLSLAEIFNDDDAMEGSAGYLRIARVLRFMRLLRLLRLVKAQNVLAEILDRITSETSLIMLGIGKLIIFILMVNHLVACMWYGIGRVESGGEGTWIDDTGLQERSLAYSYFTALHWSLTQFTPASMEVVPVNTLERIYAVSVLIFAMVTFSSFISSITNAMTRLRNLKSERMDRDVKLRQYLNENKVSVLLMCRVWKCVQSIVGKSKNRLHEEDVVVLKLLPYSVRADLLEEIYAPTVCSHPLFSRLMHVCQLGMRKIFQTAIVELTLGVQHDLFLCGESGDSIYFMRSGEARYKPERAIEDNILTCSAGDWVSEPALWIHNWMYVGTFTAATPSELIGLAAPRLQHVLAGEPGVLAYAKKFATRFRCNPDDIHDCWADIELLTGWVEETFAEEDDEEAEVHNIHTGTSGHMHIASSGTIFALMKKMGNVTMSSRHSTRVSAVMPPLFRQSSESSVGSKSPSASRNSNKSHGGHTHRAQSLS